MRHRKILAIAALAVLVSNATPSTATQALFFDSVEITGVPPTTPGFTLNASGGQEALPALFKESAFTNDAHATTYVESIEPNAVTLNVMGLRPDWNVLVYPYRYRYTLDKPTANGSTTQETLNAIAKDLVIRSSVDNLPPGQACTDARIRAASQRPITFFSLFDLNTQTTPPLPRLGPTGSAINYTARGEQTAFPATSSMQVCQRLMMRNAYPWATFVDNYAGATINITTSFDAKLPGNFTTTSNIASTTARYRVPVSPPIKPASTPCTYSSGGLLGGGASITLNWGWGNTSPREFILTRPDGSVVILAGTARSFSASGSGLLGEWSLTAAMRDGTSTPITYTASSGLLGLLGASCS